MEFHLTARFSLDFITNYVVRSLLEFFCFYFILKHISMTNKQAKRMLDISSVQSEL